MALGSKPETTTVALTSTFTSTLLAVPGTNLKRYVKHMRITNGGAATTFSLGLKTAGSAPVATDAGLIGLLVALAANASFDIPFGGDGLEMTNGGLPITGGCTVASGVSMTVNAVLVPA
jgi:hypothetical protein